MMKLGMKMILVKRMIFETKTVFAMKMTFAMRTFSVPKTAFATRTAFEMRTILVTMIFVTSVLATQMNLQPARKKQCTGLKILEATTTF